MGHIVRFALALVVAGLVTAAGTAHALDCGQRLVVVGDAASYVRSVCGEPTSLSARTETRTQWVAHGVAPNVVQVAVTVTVQVRCGSTIAVRRA